MTRRCAFAHAVPTRKTDLPIKFHGVNTPALPVARKGKSGRLLRRPQRAHPAAPVDDFVTAAYNEIPLENDGTAETQGIEATGEELISVFSLGMANLADSVGATPEIVACAFPLVWLLLPSLDSDTWRTSATVRSPRVLDQFSKVL